MSYIKECRINEKWEEHQELQARRKVLIEELTKLEDQMLKKTFEIQQLRNVKSDTH